MCVCVFACVCLFVCVCIYIYIIFYICIHHKVALFLNVARCHELEGSPSALRCVCQLILGLFSPCTRSLLLPLHEVSFDAGAYLRAALAASNEALELMPQHHKALYRRGVIQTRLGNLDEAMADFKRLVALEPANVQVPPPPFPGFFF